MVSRHEDRVVLPNKGHPPFSDAQLLGTVFDLWLAGLETTVTTLHWAFLYMIHYPEIQEKVQKEIEENVGNDRDIRMSHRSQLPYTAATIMVSEL